MTGVDAARALCRLLTDPARPYRALWERHGAAYRGHDLNRAAVAKVLAAYLVDRGMLADFEEGEWPRARRDWLRSRLSGVLLTHLDLEVFMDAFGFDDGERDLLRHTLESESTPMYVPGEMQLDGLPDRSTYAVDRVLDEHVLGPDGRPAYHRTTQTVRALVDGVTECLHLFDADSATVEVSKGGVAGATSQVAEGIWAVPITLDAPLRCGETCDLVHETTFDYRDPPPPVLRRAAPRHPAELAMVVTFDRSRLPAAVHLSTWATVTDPHPMSSVVVVPDAHHEVSATWTVARAGLVGLSWEW
jgi:hypothetical protein